MKNTFIGVLLGIIIGQGIQATIAHADSATDPNTRAVRALENMNDTLKKIEQKIR